MVDVVAHRGDNWGAIENTLPAFAAAIAMGVDVVELDARVTADGVPVVLHDRTLTRVWGVPEYLDRLTAEQVARPRRAGVGIPTLTDALDLFTHSTAKVMVDLPDASGVEQIIATVAAHPVNADGRIVWCGEMRAALAAVRAALPDAVIYAERLDEGLDPAAVNVDGTAVTSELVDTVHRAGRRLSVWTIDDADAMLALLAAGVDSITTNRPDLLLRILAEPDAARDTVAQLDPEFARYRRVALDLAAEAIRTQRAARDLHIETKKHAADLVTEVDRGIERRVRDVLGAEFADHAVVGEEYGGEPGTGPTWYCDPVDGTTNFANHLPWSSFSLCLVIDDRPVVGVVADPWRGETFDAVAGAGARMNGAPMHAREQTLTGAVVLTELNGTRAWPGMSGFIDALAERAATLRVMGSGTLTLAQVAAGRSAAGHVDRFHPIDHGASVLIAVEAGAELLDRTGARMDLSVSGLLGAPVFTAAPGVRAGLAACVAACVAAGNG